MVRFGENLGSFLAQHYPGFETNIYTDPAAEARAITDEKTSLEILQTILPQIRCRACITNNLLERLESVRACLNRAIDGTPGILFSPNCVKLLTALSGAYHFRTIKASGGERTMDVPEKNNASHIADSLQYLLIGSGAFQDVMQYQRRKQMGRGQRSETALLDYDILDTDF